MAIRNGGATRKQSSETININISIPSFMSKEKDYKDAGLRQSTADSRSWINDKGDKVTNVGKDHSIVNGSHKYGESAISNAVKNLKGK